MPIPSKPQLKINALKRLMAEHDAYQQEEQELRQRIAALEQEPSRDEYEIRNHHQVLDETRKVRARVASAVTEHIADVSKLSNLKHDEEVRAKEVLELAKKNFS